MAIRFAIPEFALSDILALFGPNLLYRSRKWQKNHFSVELELRLTENMFSFPLKWALSRCSMTTGSIKSSEEKKETSVLFMQQCHLLCSSGWRTVALQLKVFNKDNFNGMLLLFYISIERHFWGVPDSFPKNCFW